MNRAELALLLGVGELDDLEAVRSAAAELARRDGRPVIVTLAESLQLANVAASIVIQQQGTTDTATVAEIEEVLRGLMEN